MDPVQFALMENGRPQARIDAQDQQNAQVFNQVLQGANMFQQGNIARAQMAQTKQLTMAQMAQNQTQFNALQGLREKEFNVNSQKTMADIAQANAVTDMDVTQQKLIQSQADLIPKQHANQAFITNILSQPEAKDPATGAQYISSQFANAPFPDALTNLDRQDALTTNNLAVTQSATGIAFKSNLTQQLNTLGEAASMGLPMQNYRVKDGNPSDPTTYNMQQLGADVLAKKVQMQQNLIQTQQAGRIEVAKIQAGARTDTGKAILGDLSRQAIEADKQVTALSNKFPPASATDIMAAKNAAAAAHAKYDAVMKGNPPSDDAIDIPGQSAANSNNMQNPSGVPIPPNQQAGSAFLNGLFGQ